MRLWYCYNWEAAHFLPDIDAHDLCCESQEVLGAFLEGDIPLDRSSEGVLSDTLAILACKVSRACTRACVCS